MKNLSLIIVLFWFAQNLAAQTTLFYQGFENRGSTSCSENWGYVGGIRNLDNPKSGVYSSRIGRAGESNTIDFNTVDVSGMSNLTLKVHHSVIAGNGSGLDDYEGAIILVSLNGSLYMPIARISGGADYGYTYSTQNVGVIGANPACSFTTTNPLNYSIPAGTNTIAIRIMSVTGINCKRFSNNMNTGIASNYDGNNEGFYVDDISIVSNDTNIQNIWTGNFDSDWFNCRNWHNNLIPTAQTSVIINESAANNCVIGNTPNKIAECKEITVTSSSSVTRNLTIQNNSSLTVNGSFNVTKTADATPVVVELLNGSTLNCNSLTLTGTSNGSENAVLRVEDNTSRVNVFGDFVNNIGGSLDMDNGTSATGVFALSGNWVSNGLESDFKENGSSVIFNGVNAQTLSTNGFSEIFNNLTIDKGNAQVTLLADITINTNGVLSLNDDYIVLNANTLTILNSSANAIQNIGSGALVSERNDNNSRVSWNIGNDAALHEFPFSRGVNGDYVPFLFELNSGNAGFVTVSTFGTGTNNLPWPNGAISTVNNLGNPDNSDATVDRFWHIDVTGNATTTLHFSYANNELPAAPYNDFTELVAQRYETSNDQWQQPLTGQVAIANRVTISGVDNFGTYALANENSTLPVEMLFFNAEKLGKTVKLNWATESENNTEVFVVERSLNAVDFETIGEVAAVGFSTNRNDYDYIDNKPANGYNYYRLKVTDFDNTSTFSNVVAVKFEKASSVNVYPNPVMAERRVNIDAPFKIEKLNVVNALGQTVMQVENPENTLQLPTEWTAGVYYMVFETEGQSIVNKIMIQN